MNAKTKNLILLILIFAVTIASIFTFYNFKEKKFTVKLGLDLRSGSHLTLRLVPIPDLETGKMKDISVATVKQTITVLEKRLNPQGTKEIIIRQEGLDRIIVEIPEETNLKKVEDLIKKTAHLEFKEQKVNPSLKQVEWVTVMEGTAIKEARATYDPNGQPIVSFTLTNDGAKKFAEITTRNLHKPIAIFFDGNLISAPVVQSTILGGSGQISGGKMDLDECKNLEVLLNAGALPVPVEILESMTVSPILGAESLKKSLVAGGLGLAIVIIFMGIYYLVPGVLADVALIIYSIIVLASMSMGQFVLTLPGIAGFVLSIGMAVDANILIFERLKEELRTDKSLRGAVDTAFKRAFSSIWDSHVTTFMGALVLYYFGASSIKGFGLTLMLGTFWSLITAVFVTRVFFNFILNNQICTNRKLFGE
ncbi:MAG: protein translocase subunit SecD [Armatimonadota bacterium]